TNPPSCHIKRFRQGMKLDSYFFRTVELKEAIGLVSVVSDFGVRGVVAYEYVVPLPELYESFVKVRVGHGSRRIIGIIHEKQLCLPFHVLGYGVQVGEESILLKQ